MNLADALGRWAEETPFAIAIAERERLVAWRELDAAVWRIASRLSAAGLRPGDRVGLSLAGNSALYLATAYAVARLGAVLLLLPVTEPKALRQALARRFELAAVIGADETAALDGIPALRAAADWGEPDAAPAATSLRAAGGAAP
jgi:non-ribosomal peptide synthetase component E (peptide arylation enzyme)